jgi:hypothetical protein
MNVFAFASNHDLIRKIQVRIIDRIEASPISAWIWIGEPGSYFVSIFANCAFVLLWHWLPLSGGWVKSQVPISRYSNAVLNDADTCLMPFGIDVLEGHYIEPGQLEILQIV